MSHRNDKRNLRQFGLIVGTGVAAVFGTMFPLMRHRRVPVWPWGIAVALALLAILAPRALYYPHILWNRLGKVLGWVNTQIILTLLFYVVFFPSGVLARVFGWDPMERDLDPDRTTYLRVSERRGRESIERPY